LGIGWGWKSFSNIQKDSLLFFKWRKLSPEINDFRKDKGIGEEWAKELYSKIMGGRQDWGIIRDCRVKGQVGIVNESFSLY